MTDASCNVSVGAPHSARTDFDSPKGIGLIVFALAAVLISDDIVFVVESGSYHFRFVQAALAFGMIAVLLRLLVNPSGELRWPLGFGKLLLWLGIITLFVFNVPPSGFVRNVGYALWLLFDVMLVFALTNSVKDEHGYRYLLRWYLCGVTAVAFVGILQVGLSVAGITPPFVREWWIEGVWARANGISYEPSYFVTFLMAGWVALDYLQLFGDPMFQPKTGRILFAVTTMGLVASTSRMGWLAMLLWWCLRSAWLLRTKGFTASTLKVTVPVLVLVLAAGFWLGFGEQSSILLSGLVETDSGDAYSANFRTEIFQGTLKIFEEHPLIGVSLGGVAVHLARDWNVEIESGDPEGKKLEGMSVSAEALAASGLVGFTFYLLYFGRLFSTPFRLSRDRELSTVVKALAWGLLFQFLLLQMNSNILRTYLWFHIGLLSAGYSLSTRGSFRAVEECDSPSSGEGQTLNPIPAR